MKADAKLALEALSNIASVVRGCVYAARKGVVAATPAGSGKMICFRRLNGRVRMEVWELYSSGCPKVTNYDLPDDIEQQAADMLDSL